MLTSTDTDGFPLDEYAFPGPLRDSLVAAILDGQKTSTTSLLFEYEFDNEPLPQPGDKAVVIDSQEQPVCVTEVTEVRVVPVGEVDLQHAIDEGEGFESVKQWRAGHENFWHSTEYRNSVENPTFVVDDSTLAVLVRFRVTAR